MPSSLTQYKTFKYLNSNLVIVIPLHTNQTQSKYWSGKKEVKLLSIHKHHVRL